MVTLPVGNPAGASAAIDVPPEINVSIAAVATEDTVRLMVHDFISISSQLIE
jgi:hypothetical protein